MIFFKISRLMKNCINGIEYTGLMNGSANTKLLFRPYMEEIMLLNDIKSTVELVAYLENRQLYGIKSEDDSVEKLLKLFKQYNVPVGMLRMHPYLRRK